MNSFGQSLSAWWQQLDQKQHLTLSYALPLMICLLLFLLFAPLIKHYQESKISHEKLLSSYQWLAQQQVIDTAAPISCGNLSLLSDSSDVQKLLDQQLSDRQLLNSQWQQLTDGWQLDMFAVDGNELLAWLEQATCQGVVLKNISLQKLGSSSLKASLELMVL